VPLLRLSVAALVAFGLDRLSKILIVHGLNLASREVIDVLPPYLVLRMAWNKGINFGFLSIYDSRWLLVASALLISFLLVVWTRTRQGWIQPLAIGAIVGGALGNAFDRVRYGAVADYLNMSCCGVENLSSFNVADIFVFGGVLVLIIAGWIASRTATTPSPK